MRGIIYHNQFSCAYVCFCVCFFQVNYFLKKKRMGPKILSIFPENFLIETISNKSIASLNSSYAPEFMMIR